MFGKKNYELVIEKQNYAIKRRSLFVIINVKATITSSSIGYGSVDFGHTPLQPSVLQKQIVVLDPGTLIASQLPEYNSAPS